MATAVALLTMQMLKTLASVGKYPTGDMMNALANAIKAEKDAGKKQAMTLLFAQAWLIRKIVGYKLMCESITPDDEQKFKATHDKDGRPYKGINAVFNGINEALKGMGFPTNEVIGADGKTRRINAVTDGLVKEGIIAIVPSKKSVLLYLSQDVSSVAKAEALAGLDAYLD